jgi:hypothetical protein
MHRVYKKELEEHYIRYFEGHPEVRGDHRWKARDLRAALPAGFEGLGDRLPESVHHLHHLSGGSSQVIALALLGAASEAGPNLRWYGELLDVPISSSRQNPRAQFEFALDPAVLRERKDYSTTIDLLVSHDGLFSCAEAKYWEAGLGRCHSCAKNASDEDGGQKPDPAGTAGCSSEVLGRERYWVAAREVLGLPDRLDGRACPIAATYQGVRNVAAAQALSQGRSAVFVLFFDERNPYFAPTGSWPGWPAHLEVLLAAGGREVAYRSCSWQRLLASGAVPAPVVEWAQEKHGLEPSPARQAA